MRKNPNARLFIDFCQRLFRSDLFNERDSFIECRLLLPRKAVARASLLQKGDHLSLDTRPLSNDNKHKRHKHRAH